MNLHEDNVPLPSLLPVDSILHLCGLDATLSAQPLFAESKKYLSLYLGLSQSVYIGTHILDRVYETNGVKGPQLPPTMIYRHMLALGDSVATLLRLGCSNPAFIILRSIFESSLALEFLLQDHAAHEDRSICFNLWHILEKMKTWESHDRQTEAGRKFHHILDSDPIFSNAKQEGVDSTEAVHFFQGRLSNLPYKSFYEKYLATPKKYREWFALCSDANDRRQLAVLLKREAEYVTMYGYLSSVAHTEDVMTDIFKKQNGQMWMCGLRGPETRILTVANFANTWLLHSHRLMLSTYFVPDDPINGTFNKWYLQYREFYLGVTESTNEDVDPPNP